MKIQRYRMFFLVVMGLALLGGCATNRGENLSCNSPGTKSMVHYLPLKSATTRNYEPLPKNMPAAARVYKLNVIASQLRPCGNLILEKEVFLQRAGDPTLVLKEIREFYTPDGTLVARQSEDVTEQLPNTGAYAGSLTLPIPASAPAGKYRVLSKLVLERKNEKNPVILGWANTSFQIIGRN